MEIEHAHVRMLGNLAVTLWDCGGQDTFMENYFLHQKDNIFRGAAVLIYVLDIMSDKPDEDIRGYEECLKVLNPNYFNFIYFYLLYFLGSDGSQ